MNKSVTAIIVVVVIIVLAGGGVLLATHNHSKNPPQTNTMGNMNMNSQNHTSNNAPVATSTVTIQNFAFSPSDITVKAGSTVTWTNRDSVTHTVTENDGQAGPNSGDLAPGKSYSFTFTTSGTFKYHCSIHPEMLGTVTVTE